MGLRGLKVNQENPQQLNIKTFWLPCMSFLNHTAVAVPNLGAKTRQIKREFITNYDTY